VIFGFPQFIVLEIEPSFRRSIQRSYSPQQPLGFRQFPLAVVEGEKALHSKVQCGQG
jgi:hypothetical protein